MDPKTAKSTRVHIPVRLWELIEELATVMNATPKWCLQFMINRIEHLAIDGQVDLLGYEFVEAVQRLRSHGRLVKEIVPDEIFGKLHRNDRSKSGFVGVYPNGNGYRAEGKDPKTGHPITIGTFQDSVQAAFARYKHYQHHGLAYGKLAELMDRYREREPEFCGRMTEERLKHEVIWSEAANAKRPIEGLTPEERALERINPHEGSQAPSRKING